MDETIKAEWLAALRDPAARQWKGALGTPDGQRCCLGVLCDLAVKAGVIREPFSDGNAGVLTYTGFRGLPPHSVLRWAGMPLAYKEIRKLSTMNDKGASFAEIADAIDRQF